MSRDGSGIYSYPTGGAAVSGQAISSTAYNTRAADVLADLNAARPVTAGGTGATTAADARTNLGAMASDALLLAIAALTTANDRFLKFTGTDTVAVFDLFGTANAWASGQSFGDSNINIVLTAGVVYYGFDAGDYLAYNRASNTLSLFVGGVEIYSFSASTLTAPGFDTAGTIRARVAVSGEASGTLTAASANKHLALSGNVTLDNGVFTANDKMTFDPGTSARTFTRGSGVTMYVAGVDSATATLAANQMGGAHWRSASVVVLAGAFS